MVVLLGIILCLMALAGVWMSVTWGKVGQYLFLAICLLIMVLFVKKAINIIKKDMEQKRIEQEKARKQKEYKIQKEKDMREIIDFAKSNGFSNIEILLEQREREHDQACCSYVTALLTQPSEPTYSRGVKAGSLADNVAYLTNVQKKAEYEKQLSDNRQMMDRGLAYRSKSYLTEGKIINRMKEIPDSDTYVELLRKYFYNSDEILRKM